MPSLGRFASADTIVPDPSNPQQFNRFSYVLNNPIYFTDPSGHCVLGYADESKTDCNLTPPVPQIVTFSGDGWTNAEMAIVNAGALQVARMLYEVSGGQFSSPYEVFLAVFGGAVTFNKTGETKQNLGYAHSARLIDVNIQSDDGTITGDSAGTLWVAHELGHAFNYALSPNRTNPDYTHGQGVIDLAQKGVWVGGVRISGAENPTSWLGIYTLHAVLMAMRAMDSPVFRITTRQPRKILLICFPTTLIILLLLISMGKPDMILWLVTCRVGYL